MVRRETSGKSLARKLLMGGAHSRTTRLCYRYGGGRKHFRKIIGKTTLGWLTLRIPSFVLDMMVNGREQKNLRKTMNKKTTLGWFNLMITKLYGGYGGEWW